MILREVLHAHIPTLTTKSTVRDAVDKMAIYQFPALVVVDGDMRPVGVLTEGDLARAAELRGGLRSMKDEPACAYGTDELRVASPDAEVGAALSRMLAEDLRVLPVVEDERLCGVVLRADLMHALLANG